MPHFSGSDTSEFSHLNDLLDSGEFEEVVLRARQLLHKANTPELHLLLGRALHHMSRHEEAATAYAAASNDKTCRAEALAGQGLALCNLGRFEEALHLCRKALNHDPECVTALRNKAHALLRLRQVNEAHAAMTRALELAPDLPENHVSMGLVRMLQMHAPEAEACFRHALRLSPDCATAHANLGFMLRRMNRLQEAVECLQRAVELRPRDDVSLNNLALTWIDSRRTEEAEKALRRALDLAPDNVGYLLNLGALCRNQGRLDEAIDLCLQVREKQPGNVHARANLSTMLLHVGRTDEALIEAEALVQEFPDVASGHYNLAVALLHVRAPAKAETHALRSLELGLPPRDALLVLAQARQMAGRFEDALDAANRALELLADEKSHFTAAMALKGLGRTQEAARHLRACIEHDPADSQGAGAFLAALEEGAPTAGLSEAYLQRLFNQYAGTYDSHLTRNLAYRGPEVLARALKSLGQGQGGWRILDLGCGTGLCAPALRPLAHELAGVDISENMLRKAAQSGLYDRLELSEACDFLETEAPGFDCLAAGDMVVYMGDLERLFAGVRRVLVPGGVFVFTAEKHDAPGFELGPGSRFRHGKEYLEALAAKCGLECCSLEQDSIRREENAPVACWVVVLRKSQ
jgi:predicted TPR repeat methyltransferase